MALSNRKASEKEAFLRLLALREKAGLEILERETLETSKRETLKLLLTPCALRPSPGSCSAEHDSELRPATGAADIGFLGQY